jgi:hypothetical protein
MILGATPVRDCHGSTAGEPPTLDPARTPDASSTLWIRPGHDGAGLGGWLAGPLLLAVVSSPAAVAVTGASLLAHHLAHWLLVAVGAMVGYRLRRVLPVPARAWLAWVGLGAALTWHLPPLLDWADVDPLAHFAAHATLIAAGFSMGWVVPQLSGGQKGALFIATTAVMWPVILAELAGFAYAKYPGQAPAAGVAELLAMSLAWPAMAAWPRIRRSVGSQAVSVGVHVILGLAVVVCWVGLT